MHNQLLIILAQRPAVVKRCASGSRIFLKPEGTLVEVVPLPVRRVGAALEELEGKAQGLPKDLARRHDHYRRVRNK